MLGSFFLLRLQLENDPESLGVRVYLVHIIDYKLLRYTHFT